MNTDSESRLSPVDSRDPQGHYCGQRADTGEFQPSPPDKVGYCGPHCGHCILNPTYTLEDNVWVCVVDSSWVNR